MKVLKSLAEEHRIFRGLIARIERALGCPEPQLRSEILEALLVLLPALDRHERIEDLAFSNPSYRKSPGAAVLLKELERQHRDVERLRKEIDDSLKMDELPVDEVRRLASLLATRLTAHFATEERRLWPHYERTVSRTLDRSNGRRTRREVRKLAQETDETRRAVSDYLGGH